MAPNIQAIQNAVKSSSRFTKVIAGTLTAGFLLAQIDAVRGTLGMTPAYVMSNFYLWAGLTAAYLETSILRLVVDVCSLVYMSSHCVPLWGDRQFALFIVLVNFLATVASLFAMVLAYALTYREDYLFTAGCGFGGAVGGFAVVMWQLYPEMRLKVGPATLPFRARHLPLLLVAVTGVSALLGGSLYQFCLGCAGVLVGWTYLRFYQKIDNLQGDYSKSFAFASIFPELLQPGVGWLSGKVYGVAVAIRLVPKPQEDFQVLARRNTTDVTTGDRERQRQLGLKALNERLNQTKPTAPAPGPEGAGSSL